MMIVQIEKKAEIVGARRKDNKSIDASPPRSKTR
jgi:hypothetical protein